MKEDIVVGADGPISNVRRKIGGIVEMCTGVQYKMELDWPNHDLLEFYWDFEISDLYGWNFPKKDYFNVGVIGSFEQLDKFCEKYHMNGKIIKKEGYALPFNGSKIHSGRYFLIGDSAGMANALSKGGLAAIIYASDILSGCLKDGTSDRYEQRIRAHPAFSKDYANGMKAMLSLNQKELEIVGKLGHNKDLVNLPLSSNIRALRYPLMLSRLNKIITALKKGVEYSW
jgi:flavin-dependent dehydrogenase